MIVDLEAVKPLRMRDLPCWLPFDAWAEGGQVVMTVDPDGEPVKRTPRSVRRMAALLRNIAMEAEHQQAEMEAEAGGA